MLAHGLAGDDLVGIIIAERKGVAGLGAFIGNFLDVGEKFFHGFLVPFLIFIEIYGTIGKTKFGFWEG
jgi:hypothetical protein